MRAWTARTPSSDAGLGGADDRIHAIAIAVRRVRTAHEMPTAGPTSRPAARKRYDPSKVVSPGAGRGIRRSQTSSRPSDQYRPTAARLRAQTPRSGSRRERSRLAARACDSLAGCDQLVDRDDVDRDTRQESTPPAAVATSEAGRRSQQRCGVLSLIRPERYCRRRRVQASEP